MEKRIRSSLQISEEEFLSSATKLGFKSTNPSLKSLIHCLSHSSGLVSSLPSSLHRSVCQSITRFKLFSDSSCSDVINSPKSQPSKQLRRSTRHKKGKDDSDVRNHEEEREIAKRRVVEDLRVYAHVALLCISHPKKVFLASDLLPTVHELHDNLILFEDDSVLMSEIFNLCEEWWKEQLPGREDLISQSLPFLLSRSLTMKKKVDVHKVYALREAFTLFDFEDESIEDLKLLLIRCVISPLYLKTDEGKRFVAFTFGLSLQLMKEAMTMIRSQIPFGRKSTLEAYAEIIFRAWKVAEAGCREEMENGFLQALIDSAFHARSASLAASIRRVLGGFINQRTTDGVEKVLFRLAEPVIYRSLQVANSNVRQNALHLLLDLFPLEDPEATKEVKDTLLDKQFFLLERLLVDECPEIRVVAVEGCCRILCLFWEIIPSSSITKIITKIFDEMTHDGCNEVRLATLNGIIYLLNSPQSHEILKVLLPRLRHLILDSGLSIRAAVVDLLLLLRDIRSFQFHKVVSLDVLLSTLANDRPLVAQKITKLLMPSYFPYRVSSEEACNRCVTLIRRSPMAGARFCEFLLSEGASQQSLMELLKVLIGLALSPDKMNADQIEGLLLASANLCRNLVNDTSYGVELKKELSGKRLKCLFRAATTGSAQSSVCNIISIIGPDARDGPFDECMALVTNCSDLSDNLERQNDMRAAHRMMLSCDWFDDMFETLARLLQKIVRGCEIKFNTELPDCDAPSKKRRTRSSIKISAKLNARGKNYSKTVVSRFKDDYAIAVGISWQIKDMLTYDDTRKAIFCSKLLEMAFFSLKGLSEVSITQSVQCHYMKATPVFAYTAFALHMSLQNVSINQSNNKSGCRDSATSSSKQNSLDRTVDHLLDCTNKLFGEVDRVKTGNLPMNPQHMKNMSSRSGEKHTEDANATGPNGDGSVLINPKRISSMVKMLTAVLKFFVDATSVDIGLCNQERCLKFTLAYIEFIISSLRNYPIELPRFEEDLKETFLCLKSCFTYATKLINLVLSSSSETSETLVEAYELANNLLDLIISIEECLGSGYAGRFVSAVKQWLPDLILALASLHIKKQTRGEMISQTAYDRKKSKFPVWPSILAKLELCESNDTETDEDGNLISSLEKFSSFKKLLQMVSQLLRANFTVLDAAGVNFLIFSAVALKRRNFEVVLGLLRFVCLKLVRHEDREWKKLNTMLASLQLIYGQIEREAELTHSDDERQILQRAKGLLEPIVMYHADENVNDLEEL